MNGLNEVACYKIEHGSKVAALRRYYTSINRLVFVHKIDKIQEAIRNRGSMAIVTKKKKK